MARAVKKAPPIEVTSEDSTAWNQSSALAAIGRKTERVLEVGDTGPIRLAPVGSLVTIGVGPSVTLLHVTPGRARVGRLVKTQFTVGEKTVDATRRMEMDWAPSSEVTVLSKEGDVPMATAKKTTKKKETPANTTMAGIKARAKAKAKDRPIAADGAVELTPTKTVTTKKPVADGAAFREGTLRAVIFDALKGGATNQAAAESTAKKFPDKKITVGTISSFRAWFVKNGHLKGEGK